MKQYQDSDDENKGFMRKYGLVIGGCGLAVAAVVVVSKTFSGHGGPPPPHREEMVMIKAAPPPPPPPPPPPQTVQKQEMMEQPQDTDAAKPVEQPVDQGPALGTNITGNGPADGFGLGGKDNGFYRGSGGNGSGGSKYGWYAAEVSQSVSEALRLNPKTRDANFDIKARIWSDIAGKITRVKLAGTTGDPIVDNAIRFDVLGGFQLKSPPPDGMPMPIVMRIRARRPI
jgi:hypothetical protein